MREMDWFDWIRRAFCSGTAQELASCRLDLGSAEQRLSDYEHYSDQLQKERGILQQEINRLDAVIARLEEEVKTAGSATEGLRKQIAEAYANITQLERRIHEMEGESGEMLGIYKDWRRTNLVYQKRYIIDEYGKKVYLKNQPREYITTDSKVLSEMVGQAFNLYHPQSEMEVVEAMWAYLMADKGLNCVYRDDWTYGTMTGDFWQFSNETATLQKGDCEDFAILHVSLCVAAGVPPHRLAIFLGYYSNGGHAWGGYWDPGSRKWLLIEGTQSHIFGNGIETMKSRSEYEPYYAFNSLGEWQIQDGATFGEWVEDRDDWTLMDVAKAKLKTGINGVRRWIGVY